MGAICTAYVNGLITVEMARKMLAEVFKLSAEEIERKLTSWKLASKYL